MKRIIVTNGCHPDEPWKAVCDISHPRFKQYADRHGYDFMPMWYDGLKGDPRFVDFWNPAHFAAGAIEYARRRGFIHWVRDESLLAPNWLRYAWTLKLLDTYDLVVYVDSDIAIVDPSSDIAEGFPDDKWLAGPVVQNENGGGPGGAVYMTRGGPEARAFWQKMWEGQLWKLHPMWTDGVDFMAALGYSVMPPVRKVQESPYDVAFWRMPDAWATYWTGEMVPGVKAYHIAGGNWNPGGKAATLGEIFGRAAG
jgi:hypothetical protein